MGHSFFPKLVRADALDRYEGTSHGLFGAFWDGLADSSPLSVVVVGEPIIYLRDDDKEWDKSIVATLLGRHRYHELLPTEVREHLSVEAKRLTRVKALRLAGSKRVGERKLLRELLGYYQTFESGALVFAVLPSFAARLLLPLFLRSMVLVDSFYKRVCRR